MIRFLTPLAALLYCFVWLRPPQLGGVALPVQRVLAWAALAVLASRLLLKGPLVAGPGARGFLRWVSVFFGFLLLTLIRQLAFGENFHLLYFVMDLSKYAAGFGAAYLCYYALSANLVPARRMVIAIVLSGVVATVLVYMFLGLYFAGFRTENQVIAPTFGGALGVWPTGGFLPRLAGTTAEPQQLSVALLTPLLLMFSPQYIRRFWPVAVLSIVALVLSQSKFALISLAMTGLYLFLVYRRSRLPILAGGVVLLPPLAFALLKLPTFAGTLEAGFNAGAIVERLGNLLLLIGIIRAHPLLGIGAGNYGVVRGEMLFGDWRYEPGYTPNMDFLKVFAENGVAGFLLLLTLLGFLLRLFVRGARTVSAEDRPIYLAFLVGAVAIVLNMTIGYELLHAFFWINIGVLLYYVDGSRGARGRRVPPDTRSSDVVMGPVAPA